MTARPSASTVDYTPDNDLGRFNLIGGAAEIWFNSDTGKFLIVYFVPNTEPPAPVYWEIPDEKTLQAYVGPDADITTVADRNVTNDQILSYGALFGGSSLEIPNTDQNPLEGWATLYEAQAKVRPYLRDSEVLSRIMIAALEGRPLDRTDLEGTAWWDLRTEGERKWAIMAEADPKTAEQLMASNTQRIILDLQNSGMNDPPPEVISYLATQFTTGVWLESQLVSNIKGLVDPSSPFEVDPGLQAIVDGIGGVDQTQGEEDTVRSMLQKWLGPVYGNWTDDQIAEKAGILRNDPDAQMLFEEQLKGQRLAMFPQYENENLSYEDIATPWRNFWQQRWGVAADEIDPLFQQILTTNDSVENGALMTKEGLRRGISKVTNDIQSKITRATGGSVVR